MIRREKGVSRLRQLPTNCSVNKLPTQKVTDSEGLRTVPGELAFPHWHTSPPLVGYKSMVLISRDISGADRQKHRTRSPDLSKGFRKETSNKVQEPSLRDLLSYWKDKRQAVWKRPEQEQRPNQRKFLLISAAQRIPRFPVNTIPAFAWLFSSGFRTCPKRRARSGWLAPEDLIAPFEVG